MAFINAYGGGISSALKNNMNSVLNKKFGTTGQDYNPNDWPDDVNLLGALEIKNANGAIASFDDGADDVPISDGVFSIVPKQAGSGTPSPTNPRALSGSTGMTIYQNGKNLIDDTSFISGLPATSIGSDINTITASTRYAYIGAPGGEIMTISSRSDDADYFNSILIYGYKNGKLTYYSNTSPGTDKTVDFTSCDYVRLAIGARSVSFVVPLDLTNYGYLLLEVGSASSSYEAYKAKTPIVDTFGRTIYGGSRNTDGTLTENHQIITFDGTENGWTEYATGNGYLIAVSDMERGTWYNDDLSLCDILPKQPDNSNLGVRIGVNNNGLYVVQANTINGVSDLATFKTWLSNNNLTISFPLATPNEYQIAPISISSFLGSNNIFTDIDGGESSIDYRSSGTETIIVPTLVTKTITAPGTYNAADDNADGYSSVTVDIQAVPAGNHEDPLNGLTALKYNTGLVFSDYYVDDGVLKSELVFESRAATGYEGFQVDLSKFGLVSGNSYQITFVLDVPQDVTFNGSYPWGIKYADTSVATPGSSTFNLAPDVDFVEQTGTQNVTMTFTAAANNYLLVLYSRYHNNTLGKVTKLRDVQINPVNNN